MNNIYLSKDQNSITFKHHSIRDQPTFTTNSQLYPHFHPNHHLELSSNTRSKPSLVSVEEKNESIKNSQQNTPIHVQSQNNSEISCLNISEELLLSSQLLISNKKVSCPAKCRQHNKSEDIICLADRSRICSHCALFGVHKDHTFKSEKQFLEEIHNQQAKLAKLNRNQDELLSSIDLKEQWKELENERIGKEKELLEQLSKEFGKIVKKIQIARREIESNILQHSQSIKLLIQQQYQFYEKQIKQRSAYTQWASQAHHLILTLLDNFYGSDFDRFYRKYDEFGWDEGEVMLGQQVCLKYRLKENIRKSIEDMKSNMSNIQNFSTSIVSSQINFHSDLDTSITSLDDINKHLCFLRTQPNERQFSQMRQFPKFRNSQCLQTIHEPTRSSIGLVDKSQRMSAKCFVKKPNFSSGKKKQNKEGQMLPTSICFSQKQKINKIINKNQTSISSNSKSKVRQLLSPKSKNRPDPLAILSQYQKSGTNHLNLSDCNLSEDSAAYFLEKANKFRSPLQVNLEKNNLTTAGFNKLIPYLTNCIKINLSNCCLSEGSLDSLIRSKALRRLEECNLSGNNINAKKNWEKFQELKKMGIRIICN